jgi:hypothetical protein
MHVLGGNDIMVMVFWSQIPLCGRRPASSMCMAMSTGPGSVILTAGGMSTLVPTTTTATHVVRGFWVKCQ